MKNKITIVTLNRTNLKEHPEVICFINPKHAAYPLKVDWIKKRFAEGLRIKLLYVEGQKRAAGFIEYVPGEQAWRAVSAGGYLFIHCLYVYPNKNKNKGLGSRLVQECLDDARENRLAGVAVIAGSAAFMAHGDLFLKNGFIEAQKDGAGNELLVTQLKKAPLPRFNDWDQRLKKCKGLSIFYSRQCPWVTRLVEEIRGSGQDKDLRMSIKELKTPAQAQNAPSLYATFSLIHDGRLLADRYISVTRLRNILKKEKLI